jgi:lactate permease
MLVFRWSSSLAGLAGWCCEMLVALLAFGLNWQVFWVSQAKGLLLTFNVLLVLWPAIFLYNIVDQIGGIRAIAQALEGMVHEKGWLLILQAWMLSAIIESVAGFGLPIAMIAPLLMALGVSPVLAVATASVGHTWASSTGGMALSLRTLAGITHYSTEALYPDSAILLGLSLILTGLAVAFLLGEKRQWWRVLIVGIVAAATHYLLGVWGLISISALLAAVVGFAVGAWLTPRWGLTPGWGLAPDRRLSSNPRSPHTGQPRNPALWAGLIAYGILVAIMLVVSLLPSLNQALSTVTWTLQFPIVTSARGIVTPAESGYLFHIFTHPGTLILITVAVTLLIYRFIPNIPHLDLKSSLVSTIHSGLPASLGTLFMIGLAIAMEHTGMTLALANGLGAVVGSIYPLFAPLIGVVGSVATGSNLNSNVLFGILQKEVAVLVGASPVVILAAQTTGASLGSMIAPAKLAVGTSTSSVKGHEGEVLRYTLPICLAIALLIGVATLLMG